MNFGGVVFASPLSTTVLLLKPVSTCTILPSSGKIICHDKVSPMRQRTGIPTYCGRWDFLLEVEGGQK